MTRRLALPAALLVAALSFFVTLSDATGQSGGGQAGWTPLFDGKNLDAFTRLGDANWQIVDGAVQSDKGAGFLVTKQSYANFQLRAEFWADEKANSGIFVRCTDPQKINAENSYEVNIYDTRPDPSYGTGAIVNFAKVSPMPKAGGKWNTYDVTFNGDTMTVILNGQKTVDAHKDSKFASGPIGLQYAAGVIKWRKVEIRPL